MRNNLEILAGEINFIWNLHLWWCFDWQWKRFISISKFQVCCKYENANVTTFCRSITEKLDSISFPTLCTFKCNQGSEALPPSAVSAKQTSHAWTSNFVDLNSRHRYLSDDTKIEVIHFWLTSVIFVEIFSTGFNNIIIQTCMPLYAGVHTMFAIFAVSAQIESLLNFL